MVRDSGVLADDLIYDVGMHRGEDTAYYLAKGYRVVAVEANPELVRECSTRFADAIADGSLTIVEGAIADSEESEIPFYVDRVSVWGSIHPDWVSKKNIERSQRAISVPVVDLAACMREHGVPHYLKIDVEGADRIALAALRDLAVRPRFVSMEMERFSYEALAADLDLMVELGYDRFAAVQQADIPGREIAGSTRSGEPFAHRFPAGASGPFGDDLDAGLWRSRAAIGRKCARVHRRYRLRKRLESSRLRQTPLWKYYTRYPWIRQTALGGYHDTHAAR